MHELLRKQSMGYGMTAEDAQDRDQTFEAVFLAHWPQVYGMLVALLGDRDEAEDLALETFLRLHQYAGRLDPALNPGGWLRRVATNLGLDAIRAWKRRQHYELEAGKDALEVHPAANPSDLLVEKESQRYVRRILGEMNPRAAQLLILRYAGLSYRDIAAVTGDAAHLDRSAASTRGKRIQAALPRRRPGGLTDETFA